MVHSKIIVYLRQDGYIYMYTHLCCIYIYMYVLHIYDTMKNIVYILCIYIYVFICVFIYSFVYSSCGLGRVPVGGISQ